jgi:anaerobic C4-dicarboxylate transporter DcuA/anaerobic C4-dicarboxylate transporter DcuB
MFVVALLIVILTKIDPKVIPEQQVFGAGIIAILALFGIAWLADTFVSAYNAQIVALLSSWVTAIPLLFALALFILAALTTSQSATTRTLVPIGLSILPVGPVVAMWQALSGVLFLPANGTQLAAVAVDETGTTKIGKYVVNHSFMIPLLVSTVVAIAVGLVIARFV